MGLVASKYYEVLGEKDLAGFLRHTVYALMLVIAIAFVSHVINITMHAFEKIKLDIFLLIILTKEFICIFSLVQSHFCAY